MDVLIILVFVSLVLVAGGILFFLNRVRGGDFDHGDRLSLLPLESDEDSVSKRSQTIEKRDGDSQAIEKIASKTKTGSVLPSDPDQ
jgi:cbb3-type cytochrome oxidase maturation protein